MHLNSVLDFNFILFFSEPKTGTLCFILISLYAVLIY